MTGSFLEVPPPPAHAQALYDEDLADGGYVWNVSRLWAHQPETVKRPVRADVPGIRAERPELPPARDPGHRGRLDPRRLLLLAGVGREAGQSVGRRDRGGGSEWQRRRADGPGEGHGRVGPEGRQGPERDDARPTSRRSAIPGSMTGRSSPSPPSWPFASRFPRSTTRSALSPTRNSPSLCLGRCARPSPTAGPLSNGFWRGWQPHELAALAVPAGRVLLGRQIETRWGRVRYLRCSPPRARRLA